MPPSEANTGHPASFEKQGDAFGDRENQEAQRDEERSDHHATASSSARRRRVLIAAR
jgi:hypothetical protein